MTAAQSSFPVTHKLGNVDIFVQVSNENKLAVVANGINFTSISLQIYIGDDALN